MLLNPEILQSSRCRRSKRRKSNGPQAVGCRRSTKETGNDGGGKACTYLKTGGLEDGKYQTNEAGSAQGNIISPVLANIYMHHVLVLWYKKYFEKQGTGESFLVVYADDCLAGFEEKSETERYYEEMQK